MTAALLPQTRLVDLSCRERQVVGAYVLGATVPQVAKKYFIAQCTVKTHYKRVADRYALAGRPVHNKTQLLLELIADGWIVLPPRN